MKTYIMMFGIANIVAGGPIYNANKIKFLEERGWNVVVFPVDSGTIYVKPLAKYNGRKYEFLYHAPYIFRKSEVKQFLKQMKEQIPESQETIIETGTDFTALWGELFAKEIGAKHIIMFLDETNNSVNKFTASFFEFKYRRKELFGISKKSLLHIFSPYFEIKEPGEYVWNAWCSNSVADIEFNIDKNFPKTDYLIGSIGRLDKSFVMNIINGVCKFADSNKEKKIGLCLFGGASQRVEEFIKKTVLNYKNLQIYISGYIWPIPANIFKYIDVFVSGAGSANVSANMGVITIRMDEISNKPLGFVDNPLTGHYVKKAEKKYEVEDFLKEALIEKYMPEIVEKISIEEQWQIICDDFEYQTSYIEKNYNDKVYYPTDRVWDHKIKHLFELMIDHMLGYRKFVEMKRIYKERKNENK